MTHRPQRRSLQVRSGCRAHLVLWAISQADRPTIEVMAAMTGMPAGRVVLTVRDLCDGGMCRQVGGADDSPRWGITLLGRVALGNLGHPLAYRDTIR